MHLDMVSQAVAADASGESFAGGRFNFDGVNLAETVVAASSGEGDRPDPVEGASFKNAGGFGEADGRMQPVERLDFGRAGVVGEEELESGIYKLKHLPTGKEYTVPESQLADLVFETLE